MAKQTLESKQKRYFATCTICKKKYESDKMIKACCDYLTVNCRDTLTSKTYNKKGELL